MRLQHIYSYRGFGATVTPYGRPTLRQGDRGPDVADLQEMLNAAVGTDLDMDGVFGPATADAVKRYQTLQHLPADGIVGTTTWTALGQPASGQIIVSTAPAPKPKPSAPTAPGANVLGQITGFVSDPVNLAALAIGGGLLAYFAFRK